ncbi:hypothetical protein N2152v2_010025 [Parachlorella kessleri]
MAEMLARKGGFQVARCVDPDEKCLVKALNDLETEIKGYSGSGGCVALLYYTGTDIDNLVVAYSSPTSMQRGVFTGAVLKGLLNQSGASSVMENAELGRVDAPCPAQGQVESPLSSNVDRVPPVPVGGNDSAHGEVSLNQLPRVGLVIGVQDYDPQQIPKLEAVHDNVDAMREMLEDKGGFKVRVSMDPDQRSLVNALRDFERAIQNYDASGGCMAVLYYSGHGLMDQEFDHYMLPKDWDMERGIGAAIDYYGCKLEGRKGALSKLAGARAAVALFDCCRSLATPGAIKVPNEPDQVARNWRREISREGTGADNLLVAHSCGPKATAQEGARHGVFTAAILKNLCDGMTVAEAVTAIYDEVKLVTGGHQLPVYSSHKPAVFAKLCLAAPANSGGS